MVLSLFFSIKYYKVTDEFENFIEISELENKVLDSQLTEILHKYDSISVKNKIDSVRFNEQIQLLQSGSLTSNNTKFNSTEDSIVFYAKDLKNISKIKMFSEIIPVPLHKKRLEERGYNQVTTFCEALSNELKLPYNTSLLYRSRYSKTQTKKDKEKRKEVSNALFDVTFSEADHNKHFLLVDDVMTSGATLEACAKALLKIPNSKVSIVTIAYTQS
uniref:ComF family protein n=1 Tax=Flavobacterium sp. TaxID=239 RepID=UPI0040471009